MIRRILILGASYGSLFGTKLLMAVHDVTLVCRRASADLINMSGTEVCLPLRDETARCVTAGDPVSIREAVQSDLVLSSEIYSAVESIVIRLGGSADDLVGFDKYVAATDKLIAPFSVARAIASGATAVERVDKLVQLIGREYGITQPTIDRIIALIDAALARTKVSAA